ncbi:MAG: uroporphyrinogen decarboxylase family protein [Anaerolineae bacterium]
MNKRETVLRLLDETRTPDYVPAAFFLHFPSEYHRGQAAIDKHLEYFRYTGMDFVKIQYEFPFPHRPEIQSPEDWVKMPRYGQAFFQDQLEIVAGLVEAVKGEALVLQTLYSPFMSAGHTASDETITEHIRTAPEKARVGLEIITESILWFVRECVKRGIDGFYASTQGGERGRFDPALFANVVKPYDLAVMNEIDAACPFSILHICDYQAPYDDLAPFLDYPGDVVNCPLEVGGRAMTAREAARMFGRPYMGGLDRHGIIASGSKEEIKAAVKDVLRDAPERFILGADCTLPGDIDWDNIRTAIAAAHDHA